jgi:hypothetical protein
MKDLVTVGSWVIGQEKDFPHDKKFNVFMHWAGSGDWFVQREGEFYGDFKTLDDARKYISNWIGRNPLDI